MFGLLLPKTTIEGLIVTGFLSIHQVLTALLFYLVKPTAGGGGWWTCPVCSGNFTVEEKKLYRCWREGERGVADNSGSVADSDGVADSVRVIYSGDVGDMDNDGVCGGCCNPVTSPYGHFPCRDYI